MVQTFFDIFLNSLLWIKDLNLFNFRYYMYYIEVSLDEKNWSKILDYRMYACRSEQNLVFEPAFTKYIRITGTHSTANSVWFNIYF